MKNILLLTLNDLAIAVKNKTLLLVLFIPLFVFVSLSLVDETDAEASKINIGLLQDYVYTPEITSSIEAAENAIEVTWLENEEHGLHLLKDHSINGVVTNNDQQPGSLALLVLKKESLHTIAIVQSFSALHKAAEGPPHSSINAISSINTSRKQSETLQP